MAMNLALSSEHFKSDRPPHCKKKHICLLRASFPVGLTGVHLTLELVCGNRGPFFDGGSHGDGGCYWPLAMVLTSAQTLQVEIVRIYLRNGFFLV